jgi:glycosyltransferase involved in cell wall biosynthesis
LATPSVLFDATAMPVNRGGVGRYIEGVLPELASREIELSVVCQSGDADHLAAIAPGATIIALPARYRSRPLRLIWEQLGLPRLAARLGVDVVHSAHYTMPVLSRRPVVVSMFDAIFFSDPGVHTRLKGAFFRTWIRVSLRRASAVIVCSEATRTELLHYVPRSRAPITVGYLGVDCSAFSPPSPDDIALVRRQLGIDDGGWVAFLGTLEPRKNLPALVRAYGSVAARSAATIPPLVIAGGRGWDTTLDAAIDALPDNVRVIRPGYLPFDSLAAFLGGADVFVYPSLGEGFGLPVLEAMASGAVVLTTRRLALPEVGGDAVAYTDPDDDAIAASIEALLGDALRSNALRAAAVHRAAEFTWARTADAHTAAYSGVTAVRRG